jgi:cell division septation protein DedD
VTDLLHDTAEDGFHEIQLSGKQLVALFLVVTTVIVVVFLCGVRVGRGARDAQLDEADQIATASPSSPAPQPTPTSGPASAEPPAPAAETPENLSYPKVLSGDDKASDALKKPEGVKKEEATKVQPKKADEPKSQPAPAPVVSAAPPPSPAPTAATRNPVPPPTADNFPTAGKPGTWAVQVIATRDRDVASSVLKRLIGKGYPAFLVNPPSGASPAYFKVHVGRYADRGEAEKISTRIKKEEQFQSWITR